MIGRAKRTAQNAKEIVILVDAIVESVSEGTITAQEAVTIIERVLRFESDDIFETMMANLFARRFDD